MAAGAVVGPGGFPAAGALSSFRSPAGIGKNVAVNLPVARVPPLPSMEPFARFTERSPDSREVAPQSLRLPRRAGGEGEAGRRVADPAGLQVGR